MLVSSISAYSKRLWLNEKRVVSVELNEYNEVPTTMIVMSNGDRYVVKEDMDTILKQLPEDL